MAVRTSKKENRKRDLQVLSFINEYIKCRHYSPTVDVIAEYLNLKSKNTVHYYTDPMEEKGWILSDKTHKGIRKAGTMHLTELGQQMLAVYTPDEVLKNALNRLENSQKPDQAVMVDPAEPPAVVEKPDRAFQNRVLNVHYVILSARLSNRKAVQTVNIPVLHVISAGFGTEVHSSDFSISGLGPENYLNINKDMLPAGLKIENLFALEVSGDSMVDAGIASGDYVIVQRAETAGNGDMCVVWIDDEATLKYFYREKLRVRLEAANSKIPPRNISPAHAVTIQGKVVLVVRL